LFWVFFSEIDGDLFVAQAFVFLIAGYETSASTLSFALYELALNPEIQQSLRAEILQVLSEHDGKLTYDSMQGMSYLDRVVSGEERKKVKHKFRVTCLGFDDVKFNIV
jgi:cytochrome P450